MKELSKIVLEIFNYGIFHGDICPDRVYLRKNLLGYFEPLLTDFCDASNNYNVLNGFNPNFFNYHNEEIKVFENKVARLKQELYMVGRTV